MGTPLYPSVARFAFNPTHGIDMNVDGSITPVEFQTTAPENTLFIVWTAKLTLVSTWSEVYLDNVPVSWELFMDELPLPNGLVFQQIRMGEIQNEFVVKNNYDLAVFPVGSWEVPFHNYDPDVNNPKQAKPGDVVIEIKFDFKPYTPLVLNSQDNDMDKLIIRDDLTFLKKFTSSVQGEISIL